MTRILLHVPKRHDPIPEMQRLMTGVRADIHVFPECFLSNDTLPQALELLRDADAFAICGFRDLSGEAPQEKALVIDRGDIVGTAVKSVLTRGEKRKGFVPGDGAHCIDTRFGRIGIPICYEIHFPEVARVLALQGAQLLVNIVGTGMFHDRQFDQWTTLAKARAIENELFVVGCCHHTDGIPLAFAFSPAGETLLLQRDACGSYAIDIDLSDSLRREIGYFHNRMPELWHALSQPHP